MAEFIKIFKKVDGFQVLRQYRKCHLLLYAILQVVINGISRKSLEIVNLSVKNKLIKKLRIKYKPFIRSYQDERADEVSVKPLALDSSDKNDDTGCCNVIWVFWMQGFDNAPEVVKKCNRSLSNYITDRKIIHLTRENYREYINFPEYIQAKIERGIISVTHMSDLLRLELLKSYGGTWIDATVLVTGKIPKYMLDSDLFLFQSLKPGLDGHSTSVSNWFISAKPNDDIISLTLALLYNYWKKNDELIDYYLFHDFFQLATEIYQEEWKNVIPFSNSTPHILLLRLFERYNEDIWQAIKSQTAVHKLSYKNLDDQVEQNETYYYYIIKSDDA